MKKVHIVGGGNYEYQALFKKLGFEVVQGLLQADLVVFTGGEDVSPHYYGAVKHEYTHNNVQRDNKESVWFGIAMDNNIPMVGICRGGQFLNVMNGGEMYQHVSSHTRPHYLTDLHTGETVYVSSTHHQMMKPCASAIIVATANQQGSREWYEGQVFKRDISTEDIEVVFYPATKSLCFQPHPEFDEPAYAGMVDYFKSLLDRFFHEDLCNTSEAEQGVC